MKPAQDERAVSAPPGTLSLEQAAVLMLLDRVDALEAEVRELAAEVANLKRSGRARDKS